MNSFFETTHLFSAYAMEHLMVLLGFLGFVLVFFKWMRSKSREEQRKALWALAVLFSVMQLAKIPLNLYTGTFDVTMDVPLHLCNFLPFVLVWVYAKSSRKVWGTVFFWIVLGVSQANLTPSVEFSLFHYDAIRYWGVHLGLVLLALYPAIAWEWELERGDVIRTVIWLNIAAGIVFGLNMIFSSNYMYVMGKPPGTTFYSLLPPWPSYILVLEVILMTWSLMVYSTFKWIKKREGVFFSWSGTSETGDRRA